MAIEHTFVARSVDNGGVAYALPLGTALPTAATLPLAGPIKAGDLGTLAQDGLTISETRESNTVPDFDGNDYITFQAKYSVEIKFKLLDVDKEQVLRLLHGAENVVVTPATSSHGNLTEVNHTGDQLPLLAFVFTTRSGDKLRFDTVEYARVSNVAEFKLESQDATGVEVTIKGSKDGEGRLFRSFTDDGKTIPGPVSKTVVATGAWRFGVGGQHSIELGAATSNADVKAAIEDIYGFSGTATVTGATAGTWAISLSAGAVVSVTGLATIS